MAGIMMPRATSMTELRTLARVSRNNQIVNWVAVIAIPIFGYASAGDRDLALDTSWLLWGQVLFWIAVVVSLVVMTPGSLRLAKKTAELPDGPIPDEVMQEVRSPIFPALGAFLTILFVIIVYLMVAKPDL
jgi:uncharacterized membrane protein